MFVSVCESVRVCVCTFLCPQKKTPMYLNWSSGPSVNCLEVLLSAAYYSAGVLK